MHGNNGVKRLQDMKMVMCAKREIGVTKKIDPSKRKSVECGGLDERVQLSCIE